MSLQPTLLTGLNTKFCVGMFLKFSESTNINNRMKRNNRKALDKSAERNSRKNLNVKCILGFIFKFSMTTVLYNNNPKKF